jgi:hypothetical protein
MDQPSPYVLQAMQSLGQGMPPAQQPMMDPAMLAGAVKQRKAWQAQNPGGNYIAHNLMQAGRNVMGVPGQVLGGIQSFPGLFGLGAKPPV